MALVKRGKRGKKSQPIADVPIQFKPFRSDATEIKNLAAGFHKTQPDMVRELVAEALKARRLKAVGHDETTRAVVLAQQGAMREELAPLVAEIAELREQIERHEGRVATEFDHAGRQLKFIVLAVRFIVVEVIICRLLLRDYVYKVYKIFVEKEGKPVKELESNFAKRVEVFRGEAGGELDALSEAGAAPLHALAGRAGDFDGATAGKA